MKRPIEDLLRDAERGRAPKPETMGRLNEQAHALATSLAKTGQKSYDALLNVNGQNGREQWTIRMERIHSQI